MRKAVKITGILMAICLVIVAGIIVLLVWEPIPRPFESKAWKDASSDYFVQRHAMCDDLMRTHKIVGMKRAELYELLGKPDMGSSDSVGWELGVVGGWDDNHLYVNFKNDTVEKYEIYRR